jgi:NAD(P)H-nitrite reductase large subunit
VKAGVIHSAATLCIVAVALLVYDRTVVRPARLIGVVDIGEVYRLKEAEFTQIVTKGASDDERQKALAMARQFAQRLPLALEELPRDCACLVMMRTAVAGIPPNATDLTALLKRKVDLP